MINASSNQESSESSGSLADIFRAELQSAGITDTPPEADEQAATSTDEVPQATRDEAESSEVGESSVTDSRKPSEKNPDVEEVFVTDSTGRKKIKIDFSNREKIKQYVAKAHGFDKFRQERDNYKVELEKVKPEYTELKTSWNKLESAFENDGIKGIINLLLDDQQAYDTYLQNEIARAKKLEDASPEELRQMDLEERLSRESKERERLAKKIEEREKLDALRKEEGEQKYYQSLLDPAFNKYRFAGKLGDAAVEASYDEAVWNAGLKQIENLPENIELTAAVVDSVFRKVATTFQKAVSNQANTKAKQVIARKKLDAQEQASTMASRASKNNTREAGLENDLMNGGFNSAFKNFFNLK